MDILGTVATIAERMDLVCIGVLFFLFLLHLRPFHTFKNQQDSVLIECM
jgi:hypothetical protein